MMITTDIVPFQNPWICWSHLTTDVKTRIHYVDMKWTNRIVRMLQVLWKGAQDPVVFVEVSTHHSIIPFSLAQTKLNSKLHSVLQSCWETFSRARIFLFSTWVEGGAGIPLPSELKRELRALDKVSQRLCKTECSLLFNSVCVNESLLPNY